MVIEMLWVLIRNEYRYWIAQQFRKLPDSDHYRFVAEYLKKEVNRGRGNFFRELIKEFQEVLDSERKRCYNNSVKRR